MQMLYATDSEQEDAENQPLLLDSDDDNPGLLHQSDSDNALEPSTKKRRYMKRKNEKLIFLGSPVCRYAHLRLYGVGTTALSKVRSGEVAYSMHDHRMQEPKHPNIGVSLVRKVDR